MIAPSTDKATPSISMSTQTLSSTPLTIADSSVSADDTSADNDTDTSPSMLKVTTTMSSLDTHTTTTMPDVLNSDGNTIVSSAEFSFIPVTSAPGEVMSTPSQPFLQALSNTKNNTNNNKEGSKNQCEVLASHLPFCGKYVPFPLNMTIPIAQVIDNHTAVFAHNFRGALRNIYHSKEDFLDGCGTMIDQAYCLTSFQACHQNTTLRYCRAAPLLPADVTSFTKMRDNGKYTLATCEAFPSNTTDLPLDKLLSNILCSPKSEEKSNYFTCLQLGGPLHQTSCDAFNSHSEDCYDRVVVNNKNNTYEEQFVVIPTLENETTTSIWSNTIAASDAYNDSCALLPWPRPRTRHKVRTKFSVAAESTMLSVTAVGVVVFVIVAVVFYARKSMKAKYNLVMGEDLLEASTNSVGDDVYDVGTIDPLAPNDADDQIREVYRDDPDSGHELEKM
eukprot:m.217982 g.217982  ORF g.217982 m.217982 type:complete len:447 (+) comp33247_c3_seq3:1664-3004(+)